MRSWKKIFRKFFVYFSFVSLLVALGLFFASFYFHELHFFFWQEWLILFLIIAIVNIIFWKRSPVKEQVIIRGIDSNNEAFQKQVRKVLKGYLKMSVVFWIHTLKREKALSQEAATKIILKNLKKEFRTIGWMKDLLDKIEKESLKRNNK